MEPAASIIRLMGGNKKTAELCGVHPVTVARWKQPLPHGTGGRIPVRHAPVLLGMATRNGLEIPASWFLPVSGSVVCPPEAEPVTATEGGPQAPSSTPLGWSPPD